MKKKKKILMIVVVIAFIISVIGCAANEPAPAAPAADNQPADTEPTDTEPADTEPADTEPADTEPADTEPADNQPAGERMTIEFFSSGVVQPENCVIKAAIDEALNINFINNTSLSGDDFRTQLNLRIAADDAPDAFGVMNRNDLIAMRNTGVILELTPYLDQVPNYVELAGPSIEKGYIGPELWAFTNQMNMHPSQTTYVRQDWLDNLGMSLPTNLEEFKDMLIAFREEDPNQTGVQDTFGIGGFEGVVGFSEIFNAFGVPLPGFFFVRDGEAINSLDDPATVEALAFISELYDAGVIYPQSFSQTYTQAHHGAIAGRYGAVRMAFFEMRKIEYVEEMMAIEPNTNWVPLPAIEGPRGERFHHDKDVAGGGSMRALPASLPNDPERLAKVLEIFDWVSHGEGLNKVLFGQEGVHHIRDENNVVVEITDELLRIGGYFWTWQFGGRPEAEFYQVRWAIMRDDIEFNGAVDRITTFNSILTPPDDFHPTDAQTYMNEMLVSFATGATPLSEFPAFLDTLKTTFGYQSYIDAGIEQMIERGFASR